MLPIASDSTNKETVGICLAAVNNKNTSPLEHFSNQRPNFSTLTLPACSAHASQLLTVHSQLHARALLLFSITDIGYAQRFVPFSGQHRLCRAHEQKKQNGPQYVLITAAPCLHAAVSWYGIVQQSTLLCSYKLNTTHHPICNRCAFAGNNSFRHISSSANRPAHVPPEQFDTLYCALLSLLIPPPLLKAQAFHYIGLKCPLTAQDVWCLVSS